MSTARGARVDHPPTRSGSQEPSAGQSTKVPLRGSADPDQQLLPFATIIRACCRLTPCGDRVILGSREGPHNDVAVTVLAQGQLLSREHIDRFRRVPKAGQQSTMSGAELAASAGADAGAGEQGSASGWGAFAARAPRLQ